MIINSGKIKTIIRSYENYNLTFHFHKYGLTMEVIYLPMNYIYRRDYDYKYLSQSDIDMTVLSYQFMKEARAKIKRILENPKEENQP